MITPAIILTLLALPLLVVLVVARIARRTAVDWSTSGCVGLGLVLCFTGVVHFILREPMTAMLPDWVPGRALLVSISGLVELGLAILVVTPRTREIAGWLIVGMLFLFLPVNVYAAVNHVGPGGHQWGPIYLLIRVPLQAVLIGWTWWFAVRPALERPISFSCRATLDRSPTEIADQILDTDNWSGFDGYGPLPGIERAAFEVRTPAVVGSRIRVRNSDRSRHVEEILVWEPERRLRLRLQEFSRPMSRLADSIDETWHFERTGDSTRVTRTLELRRRLSFSLSDNVDAAPRV